MNKGLGISIIILVAFSISACSFFSSDDSSESKMPGAIEDQIKYKFIEDIIYCDAGTKNTTFSDGDVGDAMDFFDGDGLPIVRIHYENNANLSKGYIDILRQAHQNSYKFKAEFDRGTTMGSKCSTFKSWGYLDEYGIFIIN